MVGVDVGAGFVVLLSSDCALQINEMKTTIKKIRRDIKRSDFFFSNVSKKKKKTKSLKSEKKLQIIKFNCLEEIEFLFFNFEYRLEIFLLFKRKKRMFVFGKNFSFET